MKDLLRRLQRLEASSAHDSAAYGSDGDPVALLPAELIAYLHGDSTPLPANIRAGLDMWLAEYQAGRNTDRSGAA